MSGREQEQEQEGGMDEGEGESYGGQSKRERSARIDKSIGLFCKRAL